MQLGKRQRAWVESLRKRADHQGRFHLAHKEPGEPYKACCLGEALITLCRLQKKRIPIDTKLRHKPDDMLFLVDGDKDHYTALNLSYHKMGLKDSVGSFIDDKGSHVEVFCDGITSTSLAGLNDRGISWPEIADIIEEYPHLLFSKSI